MEDRPLLATSDWHLLDGSAADESCEEGIRWVVSHVPIFKPVALVWLGDILDLWVASLDSVLRHNATLLQWIDGVCADAGVPIWYFRGNHEGKDIDHVVSRVREIMTRTSFRVYPELGHWKGWTLMHGHQLDPTCHGPFGFVASIATGCAGLLERVIPGFDASMIDPTTLTSPHRQKNPALQNAIREAGDRFVRENSGQLLYGHTHRRRISLDRRVVNDGTCQGANKGEFAVIWPDGTINIGEMRPEPIDED